VLKLLAVRAVAIVPLLFLVSVVAFGLNQVNPVDPAELLLGSAEASQEQVDAAREQLGLNEPVVQRYLDWLGAAVHGDLGTDVYTQEPVTSAIRTRAPVTLAMMAGALTVSLVVGLVCGILSALRAGRPADRALTVGASVGLALPSFWIGLILISALAVNRHLLPAIWPPGGHLSPSLWAKSLIIPSLALGAAASASFTRQIRSAMIGVLQQDYIRTALAKGLPMRTVVFKHALKNAAVPIVTVVGFQISTLLGGTVFLEIIYNIPGLGNWGVGAVLKNNSPVVIAFIMIAATVVVVVNLFLDVVYGWLNPKVRT
jgi:peptide/nickel transport system permease protein